MRVSYRALCLVLQLYFLLSCSAENNQTSLRERWNSANDPLNFLPSNFERALDRLPLESEISKKPWSDTYWPSSAAGLGRRWNDPNTNDDQDFSYRPFKLAQLREMSSSDLAKLSPAEKFDILNSAYDYPLLKAERARTSPESPGWEGLCHGWASAAINFAEPKSVLVRNPDNIEIPFGAADVKALIDLYTGNYSSSRIYYVAERCNFDFVENPEAKKRPECRDANAGMFHLVLANKLGVQKRGFVADINRDQQVWNQPIYSFSSQIVGERQGASPGAARGTVKEVMIRTVMGYIAETIPEWDAGIVNESEREYNYQLELNANGQIIGGAWLDESRPDFLWSQEKPKFYDVGPYKFSRLSSLLRESTDSSGITNPAN